MSDLKETLLSLPPQSALDVGCGCGAFARSVSPQCGRLVCIDSSVPLTSRWQAQDETTGTTFCCMDARRMGFSSSSFSLVFERASLHHMAEWEAALDEMLRVSSTYVLLEEPVDDPRSAAKRNTIQAQGLYLELQREVGYPHFRHFEPDVLLAAVASRGTILRSQILRCDHPVPVDEFFGSFARFVAQSDRPQFWQARLATFTDNLRGGALCDCDDLVILAEVPAGG
jgi:SAM-dependent methyltransferase